MSFAAFAAVVAAKFVDRRRRGAARRQLMRAPETPIALVKDGDRVRLKGQAVPRGPLRTAPVSQRPCIGYRVVLNYDDLGGSGFRRAVEDEAFDSCLLSDATGEAILHAPFEIRLRPDKMRFEDHPAGLFDLLKRKGIAVRDGFGRERHFQYVETVLLPGDEIIAVGRATIEIDPAGRSPSRRDPPVRCHLKGADGPVVIAAVADP